LIFEEPLLTVPTDDIVLQYDKITAITHDPETNLVFHGYDESKTAVWADPETGVSPIIWSRAVGWYVWSLVETLGHFPQSHPGYERLLSYFKTVAKGLKDAQDPESHGWWLVMNEPYPGKEGNYFESSAAAMFTYGLLAGLREGWLDEAEYAVTAANAYKGLIDDFVVENANGTLTWEGTVEVGSLGSDASFKVSACPALLFLCIYIGILANLSIPQYYTDIATVNEDTRGVAPFLMAAVEWETRNNIES
jgi:rhamnogalacturonyl hydrolase YesR